MVLQQGKGKSNKEQSLPAATHNGDSRLYWLDIKGHSELRKCHTKGHPNYISDICWVTIQFIIHTQTLVKVKGEAIKSYAGMTDLQKAGAWQLMYLKEIGMQVQTRIK